ncbi:unnamed protein product [Paramecium octaurelia]|uniref:Uncharacterized protein n=1 Tax=Paramecium octaurelia TaxID=43137 RepID=A0A8S1U3J0_PAROT|nr:unnamed protein product [Paramecium octaurelia]
MYQYSQSYHQQRKENKQNQLYNSLQLEREQVKSFIKQQELNHQQQSQFIKEQINKQTDSINTRIAQRRNSLQVDQEAKQIQKIVAYFNLRIQKIRDQVQNEDQLILIQQLEEEKLNKIIQIQNQI